MSICPICGEEVAPRSANKAHPFCSARCKSIDLGKWLSEEYRIPAPNEAGDELEGEADAGVGVGVRTDEDGEPVPRGLGSPTKTDMRH